MASEVLLQIISFAAIVCTIVFFLTGLSTLWLKYGLLRADSTLVLVNGTGALLNASYCVVFLMHAPNKRQVQIWYGVALSLLLCVLSYIKLLTPTLDDAVNRLGFVCCVFAVLMFGSPLSSVKRVLQTKNTESMVFSLSMMGFVVSFIWFCYGYLLGDFWQAMPNGLGALLGLVQLSLFAKYPSRGPTVYDMGKLAL